MEEPIPIFSTFMTWGADRRGFRSGATWAARWRRGGRQQRAAGRLLGPEPLEDRTLPAPMGAADSTVLGSLNYVAGANHTTEPPVVVYPDPSSNPAVFQALQIVALPLGDVPVIGPDAVFSQDLLNALLAGQKVSFLITFPVISSSSSAPTVLQTVNSLSLEGTLTPAGWDMKTGSPRPVFDVSFQLPGDQPLTPAFLNSLEQFAQEPLTDFRLVPVSSELGNQAFFDHIDQTLGAGQQVDWFIVPELPPELVSSGNGPGDAASGSSEILEVPSGSGVFSFATTTTGLHLRAPDGITGTLEVFNEEGEEIASTNAADDWTLPGLPAGDYFIAETPAGTVPSPPAAGAGAGQATAASSVPATTLVSVTTSVTGPLVPVLAHLSPDVGEADEPVAEDLSNETVAANTLSGLAPPLLLSAGPFGEAEEPATERGFTAFQTELIHAPPSAAGALAATDLLPGDRAEVQVGQAEEAGLHGEMEADAGGRLGQAPSGPHSPLDNLSQTVKAPAGEERAAPLYVRPAAPDVLIPEWPQRKADCLAEDCSGEGDLLRIPQGTESFQDDGGVDDLLSGMEPGGEGPGRLLLEASVFVAGVRYIRPDVFLGDSSSRKEKRPRPLSPVIPNEKGR
jgi:hypothetical protein